MSDLIRNDETVEPGTFVERDGTLYEVIEVVAATLRSNGFLGHLRDMRGESIGWVPLTGLERVEGKS